MTSTLKKYFLCGISAVALASVSTAEPGDPTINMFGVPGLIDMPTAQAVPEGQFSLTASGFSSQFRGTYHFQATPRLSGTFRYAQIRDFYEDGDPIFDRSFDLKFRFTDEGKYMPAIAVGLRDFMGTGLYTSEYVVATKTIGDRLRVTGGIGWGRMGSYNGFSNPLGKISEEYNTRPTNDFGEGGKPSTDQFFKGDAAFFGGAEYVYNDKLTFKAEYSSDAYAEETRKGTMEHNTPFNFGVNYRPSENFSFGAYYLYGSEIGLTGTILMNPYRPAITGGIEPAPIPVAARSSDLRAMQSWDRSVLPDETLRTTIRDVLDEEGIDVQAIELTDRSIRVRYTNKRYSQEAQALGRASRALTNILPPSIEVISLEPMQAGIPLSSATMRRTDLERFENQLGADQLIYNATEIADAGSDDGLIGVPDNDRKFLWGISPAFGITAFSGDQPARISYGVRSEAEYKIRPNLVLSGSIRSELGNTTEGEDELEPGTIPLVRRDQSLYGRGEAAAIEHLTLTHYGRPAENLYSRVTLGYLETMYAGVSGELLWKPVDSKLAFGAELNHVYKRDYDMGFGVQQIETYDDNPLDSITMGHLSAYYDMDNGFHATLSAGKYLAGDWGATFALDREFENGWSVGGYFTLTDVPFEEYGEGSFDKGIRISVPLDWALGTPTRSSIDADLRSLNRDGGAQLNVDGRLYDIVREGHFSDIADSWGEFWR